MEEIPGQRLGTRRFIHEGHTYYRDGEIYRSMRRSSSNCPGRAVVGANGVIVVKEVHTDMPEEFIIERAAMRDELMFRSRETFEPLRAIFDDVSRRQPQNVARGVTYNSVRSSMERERCKARPATPQTLNELGLTLDNYQPTITIYRGRVTGTVGSVALIFATDAMLAHLNVAHEVYGDGTFKVVPDRPHAVQMYTVHVRVRAVGFPAVYAFFERRTTALYIAMWQRILELASGLATNLVSAMGDYERAAISAIRQTFPNVTVRGCWFHFNQAILRRWAYLGLSEASREIVNMAMALPLALQDRFGEGLLAIETTANSIAQVHPRVHEFLAYLRRQWAPLASVVSVFGAPIRTNHFAELFHRHLADKLGGHHPNVWVFLDRLMKLTNTQDLELSRIACLNISRTMRKQQIEHEARIRDAQARLLSGVHTIGEFLRTAVPRNRGAELHQAVQRAANHMINRPLLDDQHTRDANSINNVVNDGHPGPIRLRRRNRDRGGGRSRGGGRGRGRSTDR